MFFHYEVRYWPWRSGIGYPIWAIFREGWVGVDLFFVLSGFLITGILVDTKHGEGYFRNFYARRSLRIFPLYFVFLACVFLVLPHLPRIASWQSETALGTQIYFWTYLSNFLIGIRGWGASPLLIGHTWSLAVEEQFYLIWPAVVLLASRRKLVGICLACIFGAIVFRTGLWLAGVSWIANVTLTPGRVDGLAMGALVALAVRDTHYFALIKRYARLMAFAACCLFVGLFSWRGLVNAEDAVVGTIGFSICALFFATVVCLAVTEHSRSMIYRGLTTTVLRSIGRYSYGMYILHFLVLSVLNEFGFSLRNMENIFAFRPAAHAAYILSNCLVTYGLAALSWHLFEIRFLRLKERFRYANSRVPSPPLRIGLT